jgi:hypothetical protein
LSYEKELSKLPNNPNIINVIFHKRTYKAGERFLPRGQYAFLKLEDFVSMMKNVKRYKEAFDLLNTYFDAIPDEDKPKVNKALKLLDL